MTVHGLADPRASPSARRPSASPSTATRPREVAEQLAASGVFCWDGDFYAPGPIRALGLTAGALRAGLLHYSTREEVDRLATASRVRSA